MEGFEMVGDVLDFLISQDVLDDISSPIAAMFDLQEAKVKPATMRYYVKKIYGEATPLNAESEDLHAEYLIKYAIVGCIQGGIAANLPQILETAKVKSAKMLHERLHGEWKFLDAKPIEGQEAQEDSDGLSDPLASLHGSRRNPNRKVAYGTIKESAVEIIKSFSADTDKHVVLDKIVTDLGISRSSANVYWYQVKNGKA